MLYTEDNLKKLTELPEDAVEQRVKDMLAGEPDVEVLGVSFTAREIYNKFSDCTDFRCMKADLEDSMLRDDEYYQCPVCDELHTGRHAQEEALNCCMDCCEHCGAVWSAISAELAAHEEECEDNPDKE